MGFAEAIVFVVVGWVTIYHQRSLLPKLSGSPQTSTNTPTNLSLWTIAVVLPILGLAWVSSQQISLPISVITIAFLLAIWIAQNPDQDITDPEPTLSSQQEKQLKECFLSGLYQLRAVEYHRHSNHEFIYCRGHLRSRNYKYVYDTISQNIHNVFGDRFLCQLQAKSPENIGTDFGDRDISLTDDPALDQALRYSFYLIPNAVSQVQNVRPRIVNRFIDTLINIFSVALTISTLLMVGANQRIDQLNFSQLGLSQLQDGLPYVFGIAIVILSRSIARYAIARYHRIRLPYRLCFASVLPCLGGFGYLGEIAPDLAKISTQAGINHHNQRRILFDLVVIPSFVALTISIILLLLGHWVIPITNVTIEAASASFIPPLSGLSINNSIFAALWHSLISTFSANTEFAGDAVNIFSPLAIAGFVGMSMSALQLLPLQGLDGEYLAITMGNHHHTQKIARLTRLIILAIALFAQPWLRIYSLLLFLLPTPRPLICNEGIELDKTHDLIGFILIAIALLILLPVPKFLITSF